MTLPDKKPLHTFTHHLRSRYSETDRMGYVYYGRYLEFFEVARTEMIRALGLPYRDLEEQGILLPVTHVETDYHAPVEYDQEMEIRVSIFEPPLVRLDTWYEVFTSTSEKAHVIGRVKLAFLDAQTRRPRRAPSNFLDRFN